MTATCPICRRPAAPRTRPFCSLRCSEVDLGRWLTEAYVIPGDAADASGAPGDASSDGERRRRVDPT